MAKSALELHMDARYAVAIGDGWAAIQEHEYAREAYELALQYNESAIAQAGFIARLIIRSHINSVRRRIAKIS